MKEISTKSKTFKVFSALIQGERINAKQAKKRFGVKNLRAEINRIRYSGYAVDRSTRYVANGSRVSEYLLSVPSREIVALGYAAKSRKLSVNDIKTIVA